MNLLKPFLHSHLVLAGLLFPFMAFATPQIHLETHTHSVTLEEPLEIYITIETDNAPGDIQLSTPKISGLDNFHVVGRSSSTNMQIINGVETSTVQEILQVIPEKEGTFTIGPVQAEYGGELVESNSIEISVTPSLTQNLKQSLLQNSVQNKSQLFKDEEVNKNQPEITESAPALPALKESVKVVAFSGTNWWFWSSFVFFLVAFGGGIWIGKNLAKCS